MTAVSKSAQSVKTMFPIQTEHSDLFRRSQESTNKKTQLPIGALMIVFSFMLSDVKRILRVLLTLLLHTTG